jgi:multidrug resistance efflux pump
MMKPTRVIFLVVLTLALLAGCAQATPTQEADAALPPVVRQGGDVIAEAVVEPARWSELSFEQNGTIAEVLVQEGDLVQAGEVIVRLEQTQAQTALQEARAALTLAEAQLAQTQSGTRPEQLAIYEAQLKAAQSRLAQAIADRDNLQAGSLEVDIAQAQADLASAQLNEWYAGDLHKVEGWRVFDDPNLQMTAAIEARVAAEAEVAAAKEALPAKLHTAETGVWVAAARRNVAEAQLALAEAGATSEELQIAEAAVQQAQAALAEAEVQLKRSTLVAPFAGIVTTLEAEVGETATPGTIVAVVATVDQLQITTTDLTELDIVNVAVGQPVEVSVDALPGQAWLGHVVAIDLQSVENRGDVTYPVTIELDEEVPGLRWGMTTAVTIDVE